MLNRRTFSTLLAGSVAAPALSSSVWAQAGKKMALYSGVGTEFTHYQVDVEGATLKRQGSVKVPAGVQYAWPHPSRKFLYITSSSGGPGTSGNTHHVTAFRVDAWDGDLQRETDETTDAAFFPIDALPQPLAASVPPALVDLASYERTGRLVLA